MKIKTTKFYLAAMAAMLCVSVMNANAATIDIYEGTDQVAIVTNGGLASGAVQGFLAGTNNLSNDSAQLFSFSPDNPTQEQNYLNNTLGAAPEAVFSSKYELTQSDNDENYSFTINSLYFSLKLDQDTVFFKNNTGGSITLTYQKGNGVRGNGLSHISQFNASSIPPSAVPIPPAALLFAPSLLGFAAIGYRSRARRDAEEA